MQGYEIVIGLEVHAELNTKSKVFCGCSTSFGAPPNTQCCPVCLGMPGALPSLNERAVHHAVLAGLALDCGIHSFSKQDRKHYFYPDLPKGYQISQYDLPLCYGGHLDVEGEEGSKRIGITRIHLEEDAGKLLHTEGGGGLIDYNRSGVPLIEIVSEPDIRSSGEAVAYLRKLRAVLLYAGVSDCRMNEGSFRCDVNLSIRKKGETTLGTRTEMKNLNSFQSVRRAIDYEFKRQVTVVERGEPIRQETRRYDQNSGKTFTMRVKEDAADYRFLPDPDLRPILLSEKQLEEWRKEIPPLPEERKRQYISRYGLSSYDAEQLVNTREIADYFEETLRHTPQVKTAANLILSEVFRLSSLDSLELPVPPRHLAKLCDLLAAGDINSGTCKSLLERIWCSGGDPEEIIDREGLLQINDEAVLLSIAREVLSANAKSVADYKRGKVKALTALTGQAMARTKGRGNALTIQRLLTELLAQED